MSPPNHLCCLPFRLTLRWKMLQLTWQNHLKFNQLLLKSPLCPNLSEGETKKLRYIIIPWATNSSTIYFPSKSKLLEWLWLRDTTLDKILCHNRLGDYLGCQECYVCHNKPGVFKCKDCSGRGHLHCQLCMIRVYQDTPLHHIEVSYFIMLWKCQDQY